MANINVTGTLSADVANLGTFTTGYPTNTSIGSFTGAVDHRLNVGQNSYVSPKGFTLSFGATTITVTNRSGGTLLAGSSFFLQLNYPANRPMTFDDGITPSSRCFEPKVILVDLGSPKTSDASAVCASQSVVIATTPLALLNGTTGATIDVPRALVAAWTGTAVLTVKGKDEFGNALTESSASSTSFTGKKAFKTITSVSLSANVTGLTVGIGEVLGLPVFLQSSNVILREFQDGVTTGMPGTSLSANAVMADVSTASTVYATSPVTARVKAVYVTIATAVTGVDSTVTVSTPAGTVGTITIPVAGSAAGATYSLTTGLSNTAIAAGAAITLASDGASSTASVGTFTVVLDTTGIYVTGDQTAGGSTATTGDIRGTFDPNALADGTKSFQLLVASYNPEYAGQAQFSS